MAVAGVAEARHDIAVIVEPLVNRRRPDRDIAVLCLKMPDALGGGEQADEADIPGAACLQQ